jgi:hypothetical protein
VSERIISQSGRKIQKNAKNCEEYFPALFVFSLIKPYYHALLFPSTKKIKKAKKVFLAVYGGA